MITGKKSYFKSGAEKKISPILRFKKIYNYFKLSPYPEIKELKIIIDLINKFNPDLIFSYRRRFGHRLCKNSKT